MKMIHALIAVVLTTAISCSNEEQKDSNAITSDTNSIVNSSENSAATETMPAFRLLDASGATIDLSSFKGKKVFLNIWASWCPPCRREMPSIEKLYQSVDKEKVVFVLLALDDNFETSKKYIKSKNLDLPVYYPAENLPALFNVQGIPATFIFNEQGQLIERVDGSADYDTQKYKKMLGS